MDAPGWATGQIPDSTRTSLRTLWTFAILWNLVAVPPLFFALPAALRRGERVALVALVFPFVGLVLLVQAVRTTLRLGKFGTSVFEMERFPASPGGLMTGVVRAHLASPPEGEVLCKLSCINRYVTGSGRNRSTWEKILWQEEQGVPAGQVAPDPAGAAIPVSFSLPGDGRETDDRNPGNRILWRLEASARLPGIDYKATFEVPVIAPPQEGGAPASAPGSRPAPASLFYPASRPFPASGHAEPPEDLPERLRCAGVKTGPAAIGGTEFIFAAARNPGAALLVTLFFLCFSIPVAALMYLSVSKPGALSAIVAVIFGVPFLLVSLLLFGIALILWLGVTRVVVGPEGVTLTDNFCGLRRTRSVPRAGISGFTIRIGMQSGDRPYYDLRIVRPAGREITAASAIKDKHLAEFLASEMTRCLS
jgi:hypothetical protein